MPAKDTKETKEVKEKDVVVEAPVKEAVVATKSKKAAKRQVTTGRVYVKSTYNNTVVTFTDTVGNTLTQCSAGQVGFRGPKKSTPYAAGIVIAKAAEKLRLYGLREVSVFVRGVGGGREAAIRALNANGINVLSIKDVTPIPHNGCRPRKARRV